MSFIIGALKTKNLCSIRKKLITLYILNLTDIIFTLFLVNTGMFFEANAIMAPVVNNMQVLSLIIKIMVPLALLLWVYQRMKKATPKQLHQSNLIIIAWVILYGLINIFHVVWSMLYVMNSIGLLFINLIYH